MTTTQEDRELLELAAKAAGYDVVWHHANQCFMITEGKLERRWNPLTDDGDCARMEEYLKLNVEWCGSHVMVTDSESSARCSEHFISHRNDQAARRLASLRVAAEIGRAMK